MLFLSLQESLKVVIMFLSQYCKETKSENLKLILDTLKKASEGNGQSTYSIDWKGYLNQAKSNMQASNHCPEVASKNNSILFTEQEVFNAMVLLLEDSYKKSQSDDIGGCLSDLSYCEYGETADPAMAYFWQQFLTKVKSQK